MVSEADNSLSYFKYFESTLGPKKKIQKKINENIDKVILPSVAC